MLQPDGITFNEARLNMIAAVAEEEGLSLPEVMREYWTNAEFKRRVDAFAHSIALSPSSRMVH